MIENNTEKAFSHSHVLASGCHLTRDIIGIGTLDEDQVYSTIKHWIRFESVWEGFVIYRENESQETHSSEHKVKELDE